MVNIGDRPAGAIATECAYLTADMFMEKYPEAATTIKDSSYVDDVIDSVHGKEKARKLAGEISFIYKKANMHVKEWLFTGDSPPVGESIPIGTESEKSRVLGILWDPQRDVLTFDVKLNFTDKKRKVRTGPYVQKMELERLLPMGLVEWSWVKS